MLRSVLDVIADVRVLWWWMAGIAFASHTIFPPPVGLGPITPADLEKTLAASLLLPGMQ